MPQKIFRLCLTLALSCCLLAPALHADGAGGPSAEDMAALRARAEAGDADARFDLELMRTAEGGLAEAQYLLGALYLHGDDCVSRDVQAAAVWFRKAAEQGHARAQYEMGVRSVNGEGVPKDYKAAAAWYRKAAEQGHPEAQHMLAAMYMRGDGVAKNDRESLAWLRKAAEQGHADSQQILGGMYLNGEVVSQDDKAAAVWFRKAAEQGHAYAQYLLGLMHANGRGLPKDEREAAAWFRKAAEQGYPEAQYNLAAYYFEGRVLPQDDREALRWWSEAGGQSGYAFRDYALCHVAEMLAAGRGVPQEEKKAKGEMGRQYLEKHCPPELRGILRNSEEGMGEQGEASEPASSGEDDPQAWRPGAPVNPDALVVSPEANEAYYEALVQSPAFEAWVESMQGNDAAPGDDGKAEAPGKGR